MSSRRPIIPEWLHRIGGPSVPHPKGQGTRKSATAADGVAVAGLAVDFLPAVLGTLNRPGRSLALPFANPPIKR